MAGKEVFTFDEAAVNAIVESVRQVKRDVRELQSRMSMSMGGPAIKIHVCKTGNDPLPAMDTSGAVPVPGEGNVTLSRLTSQGVEQTAFTRQVKNLGGSAIPANAYGLIWQEGLSGRMVTVPLTQSIYTPCRNDSAYTVPPFGVMQITGVASESSETLTLTITRPTDVGRFDKYIINSAEPIPPGQVGNGTWQLPHRLAYDHDDVEPSGEQTWGPKVDSFLAHEGPAYWKFHGLAPTVSGVHTMWVGPAVLESYIVITPPPEEEAEDDTFIEKADYAGGVLTPKSAFGKVYEKNDDEDLVETEQEELFWNIDPNDSVKCNKVLFVCQERRTGMDVVVMEICDAVPESEGG